MSDIPDWAKNRACDIANAEDPGTNWLVTDVTENYKLLETFARYAACVLTRRNVMKVHDFTIIASGLHPENDDIANIFFEAGCDDAAISFQKGVLILEFDREAASFSSAVISAVSDVLKTGAKVERIEPDHLVSLADIAKRTGLSRSAITNYHQGERAKDFPTPVARVTSESPLWDWYEVAVWMHDNEKIGREIVVEARIVKEANSVIEAQTSTQDHFVERMTERVKEIAAHEEAPVDPLLIAKRQALGEWADLTWGKGSSFAADYRAGKNDDDSNARLAEIALRRGIEIAGGGNG